MFRRECQGVGRICVSIVFKARRRRKKLYNYVSVYDSHFHYVTINMFCYAFRFLKTISHTTTRFRSVKGFLFVAVKDRKQGKLSSVAENVCELDSSFSFNNCLICKGMKIIAYFMREAFQKKTKEQGLCSKLGSNLIELSYTNEAV